MNPPPPAPVPWLPLSAGLDSIPLFTAAVALWAFTVVAAIDGLYFHLMKYRLYRRPASRFEHLLHTWNAVLFVPLTALLFLIAPKGLLLWGALGLFGLTFLIEIADVLSEPKSRRDLGGLTGSEYLMHFLMAGLRVAMVAPLFLQPANGDWRLSATGFDARPLWFVLAGLYIVVPALGIAVLHVVLGRRGAVYLAAQAAAGGPADKAGEGPVVTPTTPTAPTPQSKDAAVAAE